MVAEGLRPRTVNTYLSLLGTILNAAVDDDYLPRSPLLRKSDAGRATATRNQPVRRREVWLTRAQLDRLAEAIEQRYQALVLVAALTGMRWGELAALRWDDPRLDAPLHDGAVSGPGRLRIARAISDPRRSGRGIEQGPKTEAGIRTIALDRETVDVLRAHRELVGGGSFDRIFTTPGGSRGDGGILSSNNFAQVWKRALRKAELAHLWPEYGGLRFHDLRHPRNLADRPAGADDRRGRPPRARQCRGDDDGGRPRRQVGRPWATWGSPDSSEGWLSGAGR
jgi:integrase